MQVKPCIKFSIILTFPYFYGKINPKQSNGEKIMDFTILKDFMDRLTSQIIPGNTVSICIDNNEVFNYQSGYADVESQEKMTNDKLFNIYSCTKPLTAVAALQLYEKGMFLLSDPLYEYIPEYKKMYLENGKEASNPITIRHLFTMTSGLSYNTKTPAFEKARKLTEGKMDTLTVIKCLAQDPLLFEPGEKWNYSLSHDVLAAVIEVISGKKFRDYVKENIFTPLGMNNSYFHNDDVHDKMASQYIYRSSSNADLVQMQMENKNTDGKLEKTEKSVSLIFGREYDSGGAGITTSLSDYSKFISALACGGIGQNKERILSPSTIELMKENQLTESQRKTMNWEQLSGYGYGLGVRTLISKAESGSTGPLREFGWGGAAGASVYVDTENKLSCFYAHHMLNPQEHFYQPRLRNIIYTCLGR